MQTLVPHIKLEYFEFDKQIDKSVEICTDLIIIDGYFFPTCVNRFSLGYQISINRAEETIKHLKNFGNGVGLSRTNENEFLVKSLTTIPVFIKLNNSNQEIKLEPGECKTLFNLTTCVREAFLPPKKKTVNLKDFEIKMSIGEEFKTKPNGDLLSPCWIAINFVKFMDIGLFKRSISQSN